MRCWLATLFVVGSISAAWAEDALSFKLWPDGTPGLMRDASEKTRAFIDERSSRHGFESYILQPELVVYPSKKPNGACVIVLPGGGFGFLSTEHEGTRVCRWLNSLGVTGVLLKYRTPTRDEDLPHEKPLADAYRAIGLVRHSAAEWNIDPNRIGVLGFSAGAKVVGHLCCDRGPRSYPFNPNLDDAKGPDFGVMIYGGGFVEKEGEPRLREGFAVPDDAPPLFLTVAHDDKDLSVDAALIYLEYKRRWRPAELHIYTHGGHGFGIRDQGLPINKWTDRLGEWMDSMGFLEKH
jgi:acetyl esterase/lipase